MAWESKSQGVKGGTISGKVSVHQDLPCTLNWGYMVPNSGYLSPNRG